MSSELNTLFTGRNHIYLAETGSTNSYLKNSEGFIPEGTVVSTGFQTAGRGQAGTVWEGRRDANIMLSVLYRPVFLDARNQYMLSKAIALGVAAFIKTWLPERNDVWIKWPNDIYADNRKICGILIENNLMGARIEQSVIGIGININEAAMPAGRVSMQELSGLNYSIRELENSLFSCLEAWYLRLQRSPEEVSKAYLEALLGYNVKRRYVIEGDGRNIEAEITGVTPEGRLMLKTENEEMTFGLKEVSFRF